MDPAANQLKRTVIFSVMITSKNQECRVAYSNSKFCVVIKKKKILWKLKHSQTEEKL